MHPATQTTQNQTEPRNTGAGFYEADLEAEPGAGFRDPAFGPDFLDWLRARNGLSKRGPLAAAPDTTTLEP